MTYDDFPPTDSRTQILLLLFKFSKISFSTIQMKKLEIALPPSPSDTQEEKSGRVEWKVKRRWRKVFQGLFLDVIIIPLQ